MVVATNKDHVPKQHSIIDWFLQSTQTVLCEVWTEVLYTLQAWLRKKPVFEGLITKRDFSFEANISLDGWLSI
jgi:hypothetical protein